MSQKVGRYSGYLRPMSYVIDLLIIIGCSLWLLPLNNSVLFFVIYISLVWVIGAVQTKFYHVYRFTPLVHIFSLIFFQFVLFILFVFSFLGFLDSIAVDRFDVLSYCTIVFLIISIVKVAIFNLLKAYRTVLGGNYRRVVILGKNPKTQQLASFFKKNPAYGYTLLRIYDEQSKNESLKEVFAEIIDQDVDEIYCSLSVFDNAKIREIIEFADNNLKILKFIPDNKEIFTKKLNYQYLGITPVLALREIPINQPYHQLIKRLFDVVFSMLILIFVLSWLTPLLAILIKLGSKGPVFFKQKRNGLDYKEFYCYKFRSMYPNPEAHIHQISKNDERVTPLGKFLRKTSLDELPQFINVLKGEMSVVGPRPHMVSHTHMYAERVDKFMVRHFVKPGITGLAQVSGYRGEVEDDNHIINRVKFDIFYVENWSLLLDIKVIIQTVVNALKGDERAY